MPQLDGRITGRNNVNRTAITLFVALALWAGSASAAENEAEAVAQLLNDADEAIEDSQQYEVIGDADNTIDALVELDPGPWDLWLANTYRARVEVLDGVKDGCWTNTASANDAVETALRDHNIETESDEISSAYLVITGFGGKTNEGECVVSVSVRLLHYVEIVRPEWFTFTDNDASNFWRLTEVFSRSNVLVGAQEDMSDSIKRYALAQTNTLLLSIYKVRGRLPQKNVN